MPKEKYPGPFEKLFAVLLPVTKRPAGDEIR